jgi:hypothetical protein
MIAKFLFIIIIYIVKRTNNNQSRHVVPYKEDKIQNVRMSETHGA